MSLPVFTMQFEPMTINHLGLRLYSTLPPVISELVSNAYDAESKKVEVSLPVGPINQDSEVVVRDFGHGMDATELQSEYLPIGRNRRGHSSSNVMSKNGKVRVTGRKGLGKLSAFGVASEMEIRAVKGGHAVCLCINYEALNAWPAAHPNERHHLVVTHQFVDVRAMNIGSRPLPSRRSTSPIPLGIKPLRMNPSPRSMARRRRVATARSRCR
jgi:hypothetical protein